tara:strand:- start:3361 stop:3558 length:198 start_codon:yes stop_codon:yes gene_type:complete
VRVNVSETGLGIIIHPLLKFKKEFLSQDLMTAYRTVLNSKIHRASVIQADLDYVGSISDTNQYTD